MLTDRKPRAIADRKIGDETTAAQGGVPIMTTTTHHSNRIPAIDITIRRLNTDDADAVIRLAQRDSARPPVGELLGAEVDGRLHAAISTTTRELIADPFHRTTEVVDLLRLGVVQLDRRPLGPARRLLAWLRGGPRSGRVLAHAPSSTTPRRPTWCSGVPSEASVSRSDERRHRRRIPCQDRNPLEQGGKTR
jgi:hypothetical protein